ncbi:Hypothetical predicted protein [Octopus vulgaris]|uniref:Uncharacterized protein n=1 Tax=Octopus vulgaris TaxID=6645 RepID=A0AA36AZX9_OCTVU|nr:Hypothetical predicted protein [Octopus vulgaris]
MRVTVIHGFAIVGGRNICADGVESVAVVVVIVAVIVAVTVSVDSKDVENDIGSRSASDVPNSIYCSYLFTATSKRLDFVSNL